MTESLALPLAQGVGVEASYGTTTADSISTFTYIPSTDTSHPGIGTNTVTPNTFIGSGPAGDGTSDWQGYYYYNWYAATAEKGTSSTGVNIDVNGSICPKGWRLPANYSVDTTKSWSTLTMAYLGIATNYESSNVYYQTLIAAPPFLQRAGRYDTGSFGYGGVNAAYWSSTSQSTSNAYLFLFSANAFRPQENYGKSKFGFTLRCLAVR